MIPHLMVYRWIACEEELVYRVVDDIIVLGQPREGFNLYNPLTTYGVAYLHLITRISPIFLAQIFNPLMGALTLIPLFFLAKNLIGKKGALIASLFYTFSEVTFYRTSTFGSVEPIGILFAITTLYFYQTKKYVLSGLAYFLTFEGHILPFIWVSGALFFDAFFFGSIKKKILFLIVVTVGILALYSPFLPYQAVKNLIQPESMLKDVDVTNIFRLYSFTDLIFVGIPTFGGTAVVGLIFLCCSLKYKKGIIKEVSFSMLFSSICLFVLAYISQNAVLISPVRVLLYLFIPMSFYSAKLISSLNQKQSIVLVSVMVLVSILSYPSGFERVLWVPYSLTEGEYTAIADISYLILDKSNWYSDYPASIALLAASSRDWKGIGVPPENVAGYIERIRETGKIIDSTKNANNTEAFDQYGFKYVFYSQRMAEDAMFLQFLVPPSGRNIYFHQPLNDIWAGSSNWKMIYDNNGVKVYERIS